MENEDSRNKFRRWTFASRTNIGSCCEPRCTVSNTWVKEYEQEKRMYPRPRPATYDAGAGIDRNANLFLLDAIVNNGAKWLGIGWEVEQKASWEFQTQLLVCYYGQVIISPILCSLIGQKKNHWIPAATEPESRWPTLPSWLQAIQCSVEIVAMLHYIWSSKPLIPARCLKLWHILIVTWKDALIYSLVWPVCQPTQYPRCFTPVCTFESAVGSSGHFYSLPASILSTSAMQPTANRPSAWLILSAVTGLPVLLWASKVCCLNPRAFSVHLLT